MTRTELASVWPPTAEIAKVAGHKPISPMKAIREKCLDCCVGQVSEVRACEAVNCALWPFRSGKHPYTSGRVKNTLPQHDFTESSPIQSHTEKNGPAGAGTPPSHGSTQPARKNEHENG